MSGWFGGLSRRLASLSVLTVLGFTVPEATAGGPFGRKVVVAQTAREVAIRPQSSGTLGTFAPTPYLMVRGNGPAGGGYSPLGAFGDASMSIYGPLSSFRTSSAPVLTTTRGYDGRTQLSESNSFSAPNLPRLSPVVYPTQATNYYGFRQSGTPPWWSNAINWIDQN